MLHYLYGEKKYKVQATTVMNRKKENKRRHLTTPRSSILLLLGAARRPASAQHCIGEIGTNAAAKYANISNSRKFSPAAQQDFDRSPSAFHNALYLSMQLKSNMI